MSHRLVIRKLSEKLPDKTVGIFGIMGLICAGSYYLWSSYDKKLGGFFWNHFKKLNQKLEDSLLNPYLVTNLPIPYESGILLIRDDKGNIVMSLGRRENKVNPGEFRNDWTLICGKAKSLSIGNTEMYNYSDDRFIENGKQISEVDCRKIIFENPVDSLNREVLEKITGMNDIYDIKDFNRLIMKINLGEWRFITTSKRVRVNGNYIDNFKTTIGICCITLSTDEIAELNEKLEKYPTRKQLFFRSMSYSFEQNALNRKLVVNIGNSSSNNKISKFYDNTVFIRYADVLEELLSLPL